MVLRTLPRVGRGEVSKRCMSDPPDRRNRTVSVTLSAIGARKTTHGRLHGVVRRWKERAAAVTSPFQEVTGAFSAFFGHVTTSNVVKCPKDAGEPVLLASSARLRHPQREGGPASTTQGGVFKHATHVWHRPGADHTGPAPRRTFATGPRTREPFGDSLNERHFRPHDFWRRR